MLEQDICRQRARSTSRLLWDANAKGRLDTMRQETLDKQAGQWEEINKAKNSEIVCAVRGKYFCPPEDVCAKNCTDGCVPDTALVEENARAGRTFKACPGTCDIDPLDTP